MPEDDDKENQMVRLDLYDKRRDMLYKLAERTEREKVL
jgi:hypothetical protein